jgi:glutamate dehydrogenase (NADP+)
MPSTSGAQNAFIDAGILYGPAKAANAGGVAVSGLEMAQASQRLYWTREEVDAKLRQIMRKIHTQCVEAGTEFGCKGNYVHGANIAGFVKVADAMMAQGIV